MTAKIAGKTIWNGISACRTGPQRAERRFRRGAEIIPIGQNVPPMETEGDPWPSLFSSATFEPNVAPQSRGVSHLPQLAFDTSKMLGKTISFLEIGRSGKHSARSSLRRTLDPSPRHALAENGRIMTILMPYRDYIYIINGNKKFSRLHKQKHEVGLIPRAVASRRLGKKLV